MTVYNEPKKVFSVGPIDQVLFVLGLLVYGVGQVMIATL